MQRYGGNMSYGTTEESLRNLFSGFGDVENVKIITDRETGRAKGFGFITMNNDAEANKAIEELNDKEFEGRNLRVNEAKPKEPRQRSNYNSRY
jgi:RNA recognition motif-containing protein